MRERPAHGPAIADLRVTDDLRGIVEERKSIADRRRAFEISVASESANSERLALFLQGPQPGNAVDVDDERRRGQPELQQRDQALAARQHLRAIAVPLQNFNGLGERRWPDVLERTGIHARPVLENHGHVLTVCRRWTRVYPAGSFFSDLALRLAVPQDSISFEIRAPAERVWAFLSDMQKIGGCVPGVQSVEILDETHARWNLKVKIGPLSQTFVVLTETLEQVPLTRGRFRGTAENMDMEGTVELAPHGDGTQVRYTMNVQAKGPLSRIMDNFMKSRLKGQTEEFAANVRKALET